MNPFEHDESFPKSWAERIMEAGEVLAQICRKEQTTKPKRQVTNGAILHFKREAFNIKEIKPDAVDRMGHVLKRNNEGREEVDILVT